MGLVAYLPRPPGPSQAEQLSGQLAVAAATSSSAATASSSATASSMTTANTMSSPAPAATFSSAASAAAKMRGGREATNPKYRRRKEPTIQSVQGGNLLVARFGGILRDIILMLERDLVAVVFRLMAFIDALANVGIVVPVDRAGLRRIATNLVWGQVLHQPRFVIGVEFDRREAGVGEHRLVLSNSLGL